MSSARAWRTTTTACRAGYPWVLASLVAGGWIGVARQFALPLVVWIHACIGLHFAWRLQALVPRPGCRRSMPSRCWCRLPASPAPAIALRDFAELAQQPGFLRRRLRRSAHAPDAASAAQLYMIADSLRRGALLLLAGAFAARPVRDLWERRAGVVHLDLQRPQARRRSRPASASWR